VCSEQLRFQITFVPLSTFEFSKIRLSSNTFPSPRNPATNADPGFAHTSAGVPSRTISPSCRIKTRSAMVKGFLLIVRDIDGGDLRPVQYPAQLVEQIFTQSPIQCAEGFIEHQQARTRCQRTCQGHALLFSAREVCHAALPNPLRLTMLQRAGYALQFRLVAGGSFSNRRLHFR
jgi:hypothetical protein